MAWESMIPGFEHREIPANAEERQVAKDIFVYPAISLWRATMWRLLAPIITKEVTDTFKAYPPDYVVSDDLRWLDGIIEDISGSSGDIKKETADLLRQNFKAFRAAHATRTHDLGMYYSNGIVCPTNADIENTARSLFLNGSFQGVTEARLQAAIDELNNGSSPYRSDDARWIFFCANEEDFTTKWGQAGHYLDFGSEYLFNLAIRLVGREKAKSVLRTVGRPTVLIADIPMSYLREATLLEFAGNILEILFCELIGREEHSLSPGSGSALILDVAVPPACLVGHYHPSRFFHPHK
ncbi:hypothetical protein HKCCSP123_17295 [Rhodobacterales bacterium HKCCSP123]|nr:hypothetical protein [Rhodobacterales bacterium HKCCSP123]